MASGVLVSVLPRSLPPLPLWPGPSCVPCVEGRQRAAPHSFQSPPTEAPLQTLHMDIRAACLQLKQSFGSDFPVLRMHSDRGTKFSSGLLRAYFRGEGIRQTFRLPDSPQQNGIAERRIGMVMDVARTSMMHAAAPHFLWLLAVRYAAHQINLHPRVAMPETSPALLWTGKVGDASAFRVWGSRAFVHDLSADKLCPRAAPYVFLGFPTSATIPPLAVFCPPTTLRPRPVDPLPPQGPAPSSVSQVDAVEPVKVTGDSGAAGGAEPGGADSGGVLSLGILRLGVLSLGVLRLEVLSLGVPRLEVLSLGVRSLWELDLLVRATGAGASSAAEGADAAGPVGARTGSTGAAGPASTSGAGAAEGVGAEAAAVVPGGGPAWGAPSAGGGTGAGGAAGASATAGGTGAVPAPVSPLPAPSSYTSPTGGLAERREPASRPVSPVRPARTSGCGSCQRPPPVRGTHQMSLLPSTAPLRAPLPSPPASSLPALADPESDSLRAASPTITRLLATVVSDPLFELSAASALVVELVDFAARYCLDYAARLVAESESVSPTSVGGECALGTDVLEDREEEF
ncbi:unnamed protein product [Closterium sp. NIES-65]|nr:unnamed protein product [Closterium sp. NIES-65]